MDSHGKLPTKNTQEKKYWAYEVNSGREKGGRSKERKKRVTSLVSNLSAWKLKMASLKIILSLI